MNEEPKNIWKKPWKGPRGLLLWFALLGCAVFVLVVCAGLVLKSGKVGGVYVLLVALIASLCVALGGTLSVMFVRWIWCWRNFKRFLFGVACFVTLIVLAYAVENWRGKRAWDQHKRQLEAKGEKFAISQLAPPPVPDEKNFALTPLFWPALGVDYVNERQVWRDTNALARLQTVRAELPVRRETNDHLVLGSLEKGTFADLDACREFYRGNTNYPQPAAPGKPADDILVALGKFDAELRELSEAAVARPYSRFPVKYDYEPCWAILLPHLAHLKGLCSLTQMRAIAKLDLGRPADALSDLKVGLRLSDSIREEPILINHLVRIATLAINLQTIREGLVRHAWSEAELAELDKYLGSVDVLAEYKLAMRGERAMSTSGVDWLRRQRFKTDVMNYLGTEEGGSASTPNVGFNPFPSGWFYQNMLTISEMHQDFTLAAVDEKAHRAFPDIGDKLDPVVKKMPTRPYTLFAKLLMPALSKAVRKSARMQTYVDEARVACALERYRLAPQSGGKLPETLDVLAPRFIEKIPTDVIDGQPLRYRAKSDGSYLLYSVGWNKTDDGGEVVWTTGKTPSVNLAKGDWVWQMPGKLERLAANIER